MAANTCPSRPGRPADPLPGASRQVDAVVNGRTGVSLENEPLGEQGGRLEAGAGFPSPAGMRAMSVKVTGYACRRVCMTPNTVDPYHHSKKG